MKRLFLKTLVAVMALPMIGVAHADSKGLGAGDMPTKSSARWIADGQNMVKDLQAEGYSTDLQYGDDDIPNQLAQIENRVTKKPKVLVIAAIDGTTLTDVLKKAHEAGV